jgi:general secretion pathway protein A
MSQTFLGPQPFAEHIPVEQLLCDERMQEGLARLDYFAHHGRLALVTGHTGVGKSSLIRLFLTRLGRTAFAPIYIYLTPVGASGFLKLIVSQLGEAPRRGKERLFLQILERVDSSELTTILVVDEAQLLPPDALTDLRLLVSSHDSQRLKILISGQESIRDQLRRTRHLDLVHRLSVHYRIRPLSKEQTVAYLDQRLKAAGAASCVFEPEAKSFIHDYSKGIPRQINNLATACLLGAASRGTQKITEALVHELSQEVDYV